MMKVNPVLELPSQDLPLDLEKQQKWNSHIGRALSEGSQLLAARVNGLLPKNGSEAMTGNLDMGGHNIINVGSGANGSVVDSVTTTYTTNANLTTVIPTDDTIPLSTEGDQVLTTSISPKTTTNKLRIRATGFGVCAATTYSLSVALFQGTTCIDAAYYTPTIASGGMAFSLEAEYTPGTTSSQTISVRVGPSAAGTVRLNGTAAGRIFGGAANATLVVEEIKA